MSIFLPNEIWILIFQFHRVNIRKLAAKYKANIHGEIVNLFTNDNYLLYDNNNRVQHGPFFIFYCGWPYVNRKHMLRKGRVVHKEKNNKRYYLQCNRKCDNTYMVDLTCADLYELDRDV